MNLVLVTYLGSDSGLMPVGPLTLATMARDHGWAVRVRDLPPVAAEAAFLEELAPCDIVGFSTLSSTFHRSLRLARVVKARYPGVTVVMGGPQATATAREVLAWGDAVDMIFLGEAEAGWRAFIQGEPLAAVPGLLFRQNGEVTETPAAPMVMDLDTLPMPAFDLYQPARGGFSIPLESGRGCPFRCTYCSTNQYFSRRFRTKSPARILAEMDRLHDLYQIQTFDLIQDNFITNRKMVAAFCQAMIAHPRRYAWSISARPDKMDPALAAQLKAAGCKGVFLGLESGSESIQKLVRKNLKLGPAVANIDQVSQMGLATMVSFIIGFPQETTQDLRDSLNLYIYLAAERRHHLQLHLLSPLSGSHMLTTERHALAYDGMPTDFNETDDGWQEEEQALIHQHPGLFPHMFHFIGPEIPRSRYLFIAYLIRMGKMYFNNFMKIVYFWHGAAWLDFLLTAPIPRTMVTDRGFPLPHGVWMARGLQVLHDFADLLPHEGEVWRQLLAFDHACARITLLPDASPLRVTLPRALANMTGTTIPHELVMAWRDMVTCQVAIDAHGLVEVTQVLNADDMERRILALCAPCGECCLAPPRLPFDLDQDGEMADFLENYLQTMEASASPFRRGVALPGGERVLVAGADGQRGLRAATAGGRERTACPHLESRDHGLVCARQESKPADCLAFPLALAVDPKDPSGWTVVEDHRTFSWRHHCALARELAAQPAMGKQYRAWVVERFTQGDHRRHAGGWDSVSEEDGVTG